MNNHIASYGDNGNLATAKQDGTTAAEKAAMARPVGGVLHNLYIFPVLVISGRGSDGSELQLKVLQYQCRQTQWLRH